METEIKVKETPILFSTDMVRAILDGRKTMTRRILKPQPSEIYHSPRYYPEGDFYAFKKPNQGTIPFIIHCPYGQAGDKLWVRETFCIVDDTEFGGERWVDYKASPKDGCDIAPAGWHNVEPENRLLKWHPSIHMPKWTCRIWLEIINVRVERVQEIKPDDLIKEGVGGITSFETLWNSLNEKRGYGWEVNPWVWVIEFKRSNNGK